MTYKENPLSQTGNGHRFECHTTKVVELFCRKGMMDKVKLLETSGELYSYYYTLENTIDYYYGTQSHGNQCNCRQDNDN